MDILIAILVVAVIAAAIIAVRQRGHAGARGLGRPRTSPLGRRGSRGRDPMAAAVAEHAQATDPQDVVVAEQRLRARSREVAAGLEAEAQRSEQQRASDQVEPGGSYTTNPWIDGDARRRTTDG
jgi:hypothetical protein